MGTRLSSCRAYSDPTSECFLLGFPGGLVVKKKKKKKKDACQYRRHSFHPWVRKIPWSRRWQPTPVFLLGKIPWTELPGRLQSMGLQGVGHD